ncbi:hypothetical protein DFJ74DRAFT_726069 [Hyaloraphidium curvatum]|nr:hypothetical protein DFJ74DRAFT_726069 [Hyaloraphidium curvatum]
MTQTRAQLAFDAAEWAALFPAPAMPPGPFEQAPPPPAPPAEKLPREELLRTLGGSLLGRMTALQFAVGPLARRVKGRVLVGLVPGYLNLAACGWAAANAPPAYGFTPLSVGIGVACVFFAMGVVVVGSLTGAWKTNLSGPPNTGLLAVAGIVRWMHLAGTADGSDGSEGGGSAQPARSPLVAHDPADPWCPCAEAGCAGGLLRRAGLLRFLEVFARAVVIAFGYAFLPYWTLFVTLGSQSWTAWYGPLCFVGGIFMGVLVNGVNHAARFQTNVALAELSRRLRCRAVRLALSDLVERCENLLERADRGEPGTIPKGRSPPETYQQLHGGLVSSWTRGLAIINTGAVHIAAVLTGFIPSIVVSAAVGRCIPFYMIYDVLIALGVLVLTDLVNVAAGNAEVTACTGLYSRARTALAVLLARYPHADGPAAAVARRHAEVLSRYADPAGVRARFLGFVVDAAVVRNLVVTVLTVSFALFGLVRSFGVSLTMDTMCRLGSESAG